jgi:hypothetical protein
VYAIPTPRRAALSCVLTAATVCTCAALLTAAVLVPAPTVVLPAIILACIGLPMLMAYELPAAVLVLRASRPRLGRRHLARLRRDLRRLPETRHPLNR